MGGKSARFAPSGKEEAAVVDWVSIHAPVQAWNRTEDRAVCCKFPFASLSRLGNLMVNR